MKLQVITCAYALMLVNLSFHHFHRMENIHGDVEEQGAWEIALAEGAVVLQWPCVVQAKT